MPKNLHHTQSTIYQWWIIKKLGLIYISIEFAKNGLIQKYIPILLITYTLLTSNILYIRPSSIFFFDGVFFFLFLYKSIYIPSSPICSPLSVESSCYYCQWGHGESSKYGHCYSHDHGKHIEEFFRQLSRDTWAVMILF